MSLRGNSSGEPYRDLDHIDAFRDRLMELDPEDRPAFVREVKALEAQSRDRRAQGQGEPA